MRAYADPLAQAEIDRLTAKLAVLEAGEPLVSEALRDEIDRLSRELTVAQFALVGYQVAVRQAHRRQIGRQCICVFCKEGAEDAPATEEMQRVVSALAGPDEDDL